MSQLLLSRVIVSIVLVFLVSFVRADALAAQPKEAEKVEQAPPQAGEKKLDGLYLQVVTWMSGGSLSIEYRHYWFRPDGNVYFGAPPGGLESAADLSVLQKLDPKHCGTYGVVGTKITIQQNGKKPKTSELSQENDGRVLKFDGPAAIRIGKFGNEERFDATYEAGGSARGGGIFVSAAKSLVLHKDGTFESARVGGFSATGERVQTGGSSQDASRGTYQLSGNTLKLNYADGTSVATTAYPYPEKDESPPKHMGVNGQMYKLR